MNNELKRMVQGVLLCFSGWVLPAQAGDGTLKIKVKFINYTCNLTADSKNMNVPLGDINRSQLAKKGDRSPAVVFELKATDCPTKTRSYVEFKFAGKAPSEDYRAFALDKESTSSGVAVKIKSGDDYDIYPNHSAGNGYPKSNGEVTVRYAAQYVALSDDITPGTANLTTQFDMVYY
ncbi:type 1 fimbrial protein [Serratia marcescens]|uniref:fimbrial protein n=1 Tax=Serratia marcescens TaxID=615 RepID=UPI00143EB725|nr:fimbrial protein [Serratia marcescens]MBH2603317.1 type 1 fimbrial protein [Serratia marcescens]MBH2893061.1 type 1 fimbrial protein [Serratia marcescens]MBN5391181.1 type 1 fimbrial protein [Serratia marcescens]QIX78195.1 type 1 fimbrial protein [Serratia marcescens]HDT6551886.1 type 1 fimbrial protein [Serratia marcescens]